MELKYFGYITILFLLNSCVETNPDFQKLYTGEFEFIRIRNVIEMCYDSSETCVDGWTVYMSDTVRYTSEVELFGEDRLKIKFGEDTIGIYNDSIFKEIFYPVITSNAELSLPDYPMGGHNFFEGYFLGRDTIMMNFHYGFGMGVYTEYDVLGVRK